METQKTEIKPLVIKTSHTVDKITRQNLDSYVKFVVYRIGLNIRAVLFFALGLILFSRCLFVISSPPMLLFVCLYFLLIPFGITVQRVMREFKLLSVIANHFGNDVILKIK